MTIVIFLLTVIDNIDDNSFIIVIVLNLFNNLFRNILYIYLL